jgi:hypothetical protein
MRFTSAVSQPKHVSHRQPANTCLRDKPPVACPSHSTLSASHLRQYKDRQKKFVVEIEPVPRVFEKLNGLGKTLSREFTGQHTGSL